MSDHGRSAADIEAWLIERLHAYLADIGWGVGGGRRFGGGRRRRGTEVWRRTAGQRRAAQRWAAAGRRRRVCGGRRRGVGRRRGGVGGRETGEIDPHLPFSYYGLDSLDAVALATELEAWLGEPVAPDIAWDYPTVHAVAAYLAEDDGAYRVEGVDGVDRGDGVAGADGVGSEGDQAAAALLAEIDDEGSR